MLQGWVIILAALAYIGLLFAIASYGDSRRENARHRSRLLIYPLSLAIYCTSWTFFGSVGLASRTGWDFLTIYIGPVVVIGLCFPLVIRIVRLAKAHNITSIADFIAARYGKGQAVAATVASIAIVGSVPYIALQLKAVSASLTTILTHAGTVVGTPVVGDLALFVAFAMAAFAVLFGTRHTDATEHQEGLMLAVAAESLVKLFAFLAVGVFVTFAMFGGPFDLLKQTLERPDIASIVSSEPQFGVLLTMTLLSAIAIVLLPRQFHVMVVENQSETEIKRAAWLFPLYLVLINVFVLPIALAGLLLLPRSESDVFVLALPLAAGSELITMTTFIGGLSAATAMVIVESVALAIMVSNDIVMPLLLKRRRASETSDIGAVLLGIRRVAIFALLFLAYVYYRISGEAQLAAIGLLSFAAIAQLAPAFFGGLIWSRGTARGAIAGMLIGIGVWAYTLMLPSFADASETLASVVRHGLFGLPFLRPQRLFFVELPPLVHGVVWSLSLNILAYVVFSLRRAPAAIERVQASFFVPSEREPAPQSFRLWRSSVTVGELAGTVARYLGEDRTRSSFESFAEMRRISVEPEHEADIHLLRHAEHLLASAIGAASSRLVLSLLLRKRAVSTEAAFRLLDEASAAIHYNREVLQTALDHMRQGIGVFDKELRLVCWNRQFGELLDVPPEHVRVGESIEDLLRAAVTETDIAARERAIRERVMRYVSASEPFVERFPERGLVVEVRPNRMPDGGVVATLTDITERVEAGEALERANETLEGRVRERTEELMRLNVALGRAKADADDANISKTRFLAAASHDILQPLNAARLYVTTLKERVRVGEEARLSANADASLEAVEEILGTLLDISRLDAGALQPEITSFPIRDVFQQLELEFAPAAKEGGLTLRFVGSSLHVASDRRLLRRLLQNFVSNAVKYTRKGRVLVGCRRHGDTLLVNVYDTGVGIPRSQMRAIFREFHRLDRGARVARGLGLGLSIVDRIAKVLDHPVRTESRLGRGSRFAVAVPVAAAVPAGTIIGNQPSPREEFGRLSDIRVLCIDNEPKILDGMRAMLAGWGCDVLTAPNLEAAIEEISRARGSVSGILADYHLDDGNGIDAVMELRWRFGADIPAILITADRSDVVREQARARGIVPLNKPVKPAALRALLGQWRIGRAAAE